MDAKLRMYLAELVGTFLVVLVGATLVCCTELTNEPRLGVLAIAIAEGAMLAVMLTVLTPLAEGGWLRDSKTPSSQATHNTTPFVMGCFNPAVTITLWVFKRLEGVPTLLLIGVQLVGASLAGLVVLTLFDQEVLLETRLGGPHIKGSFLGEGNAFNRGSMISGACTELVVTFLLTTAIFATLFDRRAPRMGGLMVGLAQAVVILMAFRLTGGAANPARWFGPALWELTLPASRSTFVQEGAVFCIGPVLGGLLGGLFCSTVLLPSEK